MQPSHFNSNLWYCCPLASRSTSLWIWWYLHKFTCGELNNKTVDCGCSSHSLNNCFVQWYVSFKYLLSEMHQNWLFFFSPIWHLAIYFLFLKKWFIFKFKFAANDKLFIYWFIYLFLSIIIISSFPIDLGKMQNYSFRIQSRVTYWFHLNMGVVLLLLVLNLHIINSKDISRANNEASKLTFVAIVSETNIVCDWNLC